MGAPVRESAIPLDRQLVVIHASADHHTAPFATRENIHNLCECRLPQIWDTTDPPAHKGSRTSQPTRSGGRYTTQHSKRTFTLLSTQNRENL